MKTSFLLHKKFTWPDFGRVYRPTDIPPVATALVNMPRLCVTDGLYFIPCLKKSTLSYENQLRHSVLRSV